PDTAKRPEQPMRTTAAVAAENDIEDLVGPDDEVIVKGDEIHVGKMKIKDGKLIMPDGSVYEQRRTPETPMTPGVRPVPPPQITLTPEQLQSLTPEQRRKLNIIRRRYPAMFPK